MEARLGGPSRRGKVRQQAMKSSARNVMVGSFVLIGFIVLGWLVFKFGDLPALVHRVASNQVEIYFPEAPGIQPNTDVLFLGYPVGRVLQVDAPRLMADVARPAVSRFLIRVVVGIGTGHAVPVNAAPKIHQRGLGSSYIEFILTDEPSTEMLAHGAKLEGALSEGTEFISEGTQRRLDELIGSLTRMTNQLQGQLEQRPPSMVDADPNGVRPNVTTVVARLDTALRSINEVIGSEENQANIKAGLAEFVAALREIRQAALQVQGLAGQAEALISKSSATVGSIDALAAETAESVRTVASTFQEVADEMVKTLDTLEQMLAKASNGEGTMGRLMNDPQLYESLTAAAVQLELAIGEFRQRLAVWAKEGILSKDKTVQTPEAKE